MSDEVTNEKQRSTNSKNSTVVNKSTGQKTWFTLSAQFRVLANREQTSAAIENPYMLWFCQIAVTQKEGRK